MSNINAVGFFELFVEDMERATAFYQEILGITLEAMYDPTGESQMMSFPADMQAYGATGALVKADYARPGPGGTQIYFSVEDCAIHATKKKSPYPKRIIGKSSRRRPPELSWRPLVKLASA